MRVVTFKIDDDTLILLDKWAAILGRPRSAVIRDALVEYLRELEARRNGRPRIVVLEG